MDPAVIAITITLFAVAFAAVLLAVRGGERRSRLVMPGPLLWVVIVLLVLGLFVAPRLLGIVFLFLPLIWIRRPPPPEPREHDRERDEDPWWGPRDEDR